MDVQKLVLSICQLLLKLHTNQQTNEQTDLTSSSLSFISSSARATFNIGLTCEEK